MTSTDMKDRLRSMAIDWRAAAEAEEAVFQSFAYVREAFHAGDRSETIMHRLRISNDARGNRDRFLRDADCLEWLLKTEEME
jgi:hypothetical protein